MKFVDVNLKKNQTDGHHQLIHTELITFSRSYHNDLF